MCPERNDFSVIKPLKIPIEISIADGNKVLAKEIGTINVVLENKKNIKIHDVLYVPGLDRRLLSISALVGKGLSVIFKNSICEIIDQNETIVKIPKTGQLYLMKCESGGQMTYEAVQIQVGSSTQEKLELWHARLGHLPATTMKNLPTMVVGLDGIQGNLNKNQIKICEGCENGKQTVASFPTSSYGEVKTTKVLELIHSDVMGPMQTKSQGGARFIVTFIDDFSRLVTAYFLESKSQVFERFVEYKALMENQLNAKIKKIRTDNGREYVNKSFAQLCRKAGIVHQTTVPYSPQQNGMAERMNRTLVERARSMIHHSNIDAMWWAEAVNTAVYITNRVPCAADQTRTPLERCFGSKPDLSNLRVFGSKGYAQIDKSKRSKFENKVFPCIFLGYSTQTKGYRVWNTQDKRLIVTRTAKFEEIQRLQYVQVVDNDQQGGRYNVDYDGDIYVEQLPQASMNQPDEHEPMEVDEIGPSVESNENTMMIPVEPMEMENNEDYLIDIPEIDTERSVVPRGRVMESSDSPLFGTTSALESDHVEPFALPPSENSQAMVPYQDNQERPNKRYRVEYGHANAALEAPTTYSEAINSIEKTKWIEAINAELKSLHEKKTWTLVNRNQATKIIGTKWVFAIKRDENGEVQRYKARLVALGYRQTQGIDYSETYSPVANMNSIRVFLAVCCHNGYLIRQYDIETAFLNGHLDENVFIWPPEGIKCEEGNVCKLNRSLYGLKQAASTWYKTISVAFVNNLKFKQCTSDSCIFVRRDGDVFTYVALYVDDMLIGAKSMEIVQEIKNSLCSQFKLKDLGDARHILGMELNYDRKSRKLNLCQAASVSRMVQKFNQVDSKEVVNPCVVGQFLAKTSESNEEKLNTEKRPYRSLVGSLLYIATCTRPDIAFAVCQLSRHLENPSDEHWKAAIRVLRYLKKTASYGIGFQGTSSQIKVCAYSDADWASNKENRRSTSGILVMMNGTPVVFKSRLQQNVSLSTAEAEYVALSLCIQEILWLKSLIKEMGINYKWPITVFEDNQSAIAIAKNNGYQSRAKHIDIRHHFIREHVKSQNIALQYIETKNQLADYLTKAIPTKQFQTLIEKSRITNCKSRGSVEVRNCYGS